jgi:hypothetical protein
MLKPLLDINADHFFGYKYAPIELVMYGDSSVRLCTCIFRDKTSSAK